MAAVTHIKPSDACGAATPFGGAGAAPACHAGPTAEVRIPAASAGCIAVALCTDEEGNEAFWRL